MIIQNNNLRDAVDAAAQANETMEGISSILNSLLEMERQGSCEAEVALPAVIRLVYDCQEDMAKTQEALEAMWKATRSA